MNLSTRKHIAVAMVCGAPASVPSQRAFCQLGNLARAVEQVQVNVNRAVSSASPEIKERAKAIPTLNASEVHKVAAPEPAEKQISVVSESQRAILLKAVTNYAGQMSRERDKFSAIAIVVLVSGAVLALIGSILSFLQLNRTAGIVTLIVTALIGLPSVYPVTALSDFYRALATQAIALETDCQLKSPFTAEDYKASEEQLRLLVVWQGQNTPTLGNSKVVTDDLAKQLQILRSGAAAFAAATTAPSPGE